ncbi:MAG: DUF2807 domain-containing protein, partial [Candidatus Doudnabacteria bacterium]|nr:DUF2807 domain-containing protein [Candidatus Doudnabacteria bacterium]
FDKVKVTQTDGRLDISSTYTGQTQFCIFCIVSKPTVIIEMPTLEGIELEGMATAYIDNLSKRDLTVSLSDSSRVFAEGEFEDIQILLRGDSQADFSGSASSLFGQIDQYAYLTALELEVDSVDLSLNDNTHAFVSAERSLNLSLQEIATAYYETTDTDIKISRTGDAVVLPYKYLLGALPDLKDIEVFLSHDIRFSTFTIFMHGHHLRLDGNSKYEYLLPTGERIWVNDNETGFDMISVILKSENGLRELIPQK